MATPQIGTLIRYRLIELHRKNVGEKYKAFKEAFNQAQQKIMTQPKLHNDRSNADAEVDEAINHFNITKTNLIEALNGLCTLDPVKGNQTKSIILDEIKKLSEEIKNKGDNNPKRHLRKPST